MYRTLLATIVIWVFSATTHAEAPPDKLVQKLTETLRKHCPEAKIETTKEGFVAKSGTMMFTLHRRSKTGEVFSETFREEGPNFKGFILRVSMHNGKYNGAAVVPQTLQDRITRPLLMRQQLRKTTSTTGLHSHTAVGLILT